MGPLDSYLRPHVLRGVDPEASDSNVHQLAEVPRHLLPHVCGGAVQIRQPDQVAVADIVRIPIVVDVACGKKEAFGSFVARYFESIGFSHKLLSKPQRLLFRLS